MIIKHVAVVRQAGDRQWWLEVFSYFVNSLRRSFTTSSADGVPDLVHIAIGCFNSFTKYAKLMQFERMGKR